MRLYNRVIKKPIVTEKTANLSLQKKAYAFEIYDSATKIDVKQAIKTIYGVEVAKVNIVNTREKFKYGRKGGMQIRKRAGKKAYVTLKNAEDTIDYTIVK